MKTAKMMLMFAFLAFGTMLFAQNPNERAIVKINIAEAVLSHGLVKAIHAQLDLNDLLRSENNGLYSGKVTFNRKVYVIFGTREQWVAFFLENDPHTPPEIRERPPEY